MSPAAPLPLFHLVGFTGHRVIAEPEKIASAVREALAGLRAEAAGEWVAVSSIAAGSDVLFAQVALQAGLGWEVVVPLPLVEFRKDFNEADWREVEALLPKAEQITVFGESGSRDDAYLDAGMQTVNQCDVLIAVWDGKPARGKGGTAEVVAYARELGKPCILIDSETGAIRREGFQHFEVADTELAFLNALPPILRAAAANPTPAGAPAHVVDFLGRADFAANRGAPHFRRLTASVVLLHAGATLVAAGTLAFQLHWMILPWLKLVGVVGAFVVALVIRRYRAQDGWVRCRLAAEITRSSLATWGLRKGVSLFETLDLNDMKQLTRTLFIERRRAAGAHPVELAEFKKRYLAERVADQHGYYSRQLAKSLPQLARLRAGFSISTILAIVCTALYAIDHTWHLGLLGKAGEQLVFYFLPIALPVVAAGFMALISINDLHRRVARYREMLHVLERARRQVEFAQSWDGVERVVMNVERALLQEVVEWRTLASHMESH